ncbi:MAG: hypothetical protein NCW75_03970 [Phycisphaera sp.]|nr:MAG: hypothetical protein NCW75_03970 [Phycisphaera sp.]
MSQKAIKHGFKTCPIKSINAEHLDELVRGIVLDHLDHGPLDAQQVEVRDHWIRTIISLVTLTETTLSIYIDNNQIHYLREYDFGTTIDAAPSRPTCSYKPETDNHGHSIRLSLNIRIKKLDGRRVLLSLDGRHLVMSSNPEPKQHIVNAIGLAYRWHNELVKSGQQIREFAHSSGIARTRILKLLPLVNLGPEVLRNALTGTLAPSITLNDLLEAAKHPDWAHQARALGLGQQVAG